MVRDTNLRLRKVFQKSGALQKHLWEKLFDNFVALESEMLMFDFCLGEISQSLTFVQFYPVDV